MNTSVMFSSATDLWATPQQFFNKLNEEFGFTLDPCATPQNAKCANYFTQEIDGLKQDWGGGTQSFATRHTVENYPNGYKKPTRKARNQAPQSLCLYRHEPIQATFTTISTTTHAKYASFADD